MGSRSGTGAEPTWTDNSGLPSYREGFADAFDEVWSMADGEATVYHDGPEPLGRLRGVDPYLDGYAAGFMAASARGLGVLRQVRRSEEMEYVFIRRSEVVLRNAA